MIKVIAFGVGSFGVGRFFSLPFLSKIREEQVSRNKEVSFPSRNIVSRRIIP
jgi:hypothetical protein